MAESYHSRRIPPGGRGEWTARQKTSLRVLSIASIQNFYWYFPPVTDTLSLIASLRFVLRSRSHSPVSPCRAWRNLKFPRRCYVGFPIYSLASGVRARDSNNGGGARRLAGA